MNFITRKSLSRRTLLKGMGVSLALPFLDAMHPAMTAERLSAAAPARRLLLVIYPHGVVDDTWNPSGSGPNFKLSESLAPLEAHRGKLTIIRGLSSAPDRNKGEFHDRAVDTFLTGCEPSLNTMHVGISIDQIAARHFSQVTPFASLELTTDAPSQTYFDGPCFRDASTNLPMERNPRVVFERLFGDSAKWDAKAQARRISDDASILDSVSSRITSLNAQLGASDRSKLDQYLESIRDLERRIRIASSGPALQLPAITRPVGVPQSWPEHMKLMLDLQVLALQADLTRVITFTTAWEASARVFDHLNLSMAFHEISHHDFEKRKLDALSKINRNHSEMLAYYLDKLDSAREPGGSLLDNSVLFYGSTLSNPTIHSQRDLPIIIAGGGAAGIKGNRSLTIPDPGNGGVPLTNLHLALLEKVGISMDKLGDSTGHLSELG